MVVHPKLQPFLDQLIATDSLVKSIPDEIADFNVYQDPTGDWEIDWFYDMDNVAALTPLKSEVLWFAYVGDKEYKGEFKHGQPVPAEFTTAVKALKEKFDGKSSS